MLNADIILSGGGVTVFTWLTSLTSASFFINWMIMATTSWQFHRFLEAQNDGLFTEVYAWKSFKWPLAPVWLMTCCLVLLACCFTAGLKPLVSSLGWPSVLQFRQSSGLFHIEVKPGTLLT